MLAAHPPPSRPIVPPLDLGPGLEATPGSVQAALDALFRDDRTAMDFSGWNMDLLRPVRGRLDIMQPLAALVQAITNCEVPLEVFWLITTGSLIATHKLEQEDQDARSALGLDPKLRPVNKSALLWKISTQVAILHPEYAAAAKMMEVEGCQFGLGAKFGMTRMAMSAQDHYNQGCAIGEMDGENAFHRASRQAMLQSLTTHCPHMSRLFWMGYCSHAPLVLMRRGNSFAVLRSSEGARMGDKFGSFAFDLVVHPAYVELKSQFTDIVFQAATDDLKSYARDPRSLCAMFPVAAAVLLRHAGVTLNQAKSAILLHPARVDFDPGDIPVGVEVKRDGLVVVGAAVGTDAFIEQHLLTVVRQQTRKFDPLFAVDPQSALLLLSGCLALALGYHLQVTPPRLALTAVHAWDVAVDAARSRIASNPAFGRAPHVGAALQNLSDRVARLPLKCKGLGQYSAALLSPIAFYAAYAQHAFLDTGTRSRLLTRELDFAFAELHNTLPANGLEMLVPVAQLGLAVPPRKLQRDLTRLAHARAYTAVKSAARHVCDVRVLAHPTDAWLPFHAAPTTALLVIEPDRYIAGLRSYLLLPQLLRLSTPAVVVDPPLSASAPDFSYEADACRHCPGSVCDRHLAHAHACRSSSNRKLRDRHELVKHARADVLRLAGFADIREEPRLSTANQRRADIFYVDNLGHRHAHYYTDDVVCHPLCATHIGAEAADPLSTLHKVEAVKAQSYAHVLDQARAASAVTAGLRVVTYHTCSYTSLGALGSGTVKCLNGAAGFLKARATRAARLAPRADGLTPQMLSGRLRFLARCQIQAAIMRGNGLIAAEVGL